MTLNHKQSPSIIQMPSLSHHLCVKGVSTLEVPVEIGKYKKRKCSRLEASFIGSKSILLQTHTCILTRGKMPTKAMLSCGSYCCLNIYGANCRQY